MEDVYDRSISLGYEGFVTGVCDLVLTDMNGLCLDPTVTLPLRPFASRSGEETLYIPLYLRPPPLLRNIV